MLWKFFGENQVSSWLIAGLEWPESTIEGCRAIGDTGAIHHVASTSTIDRNAAGRKVTSTKRGCDENLSKSERNFERA